ncbi:MAG TPA: hypothetical protein V6C72_04415 [Chroococcales cyanobacterium]
MLYHQLQQVRVQLRRREMKVSDALLIVFRYLRGRLPSERLIWLNRELLGYRSDDLPEFFEKPKHKQFSMFFPAPRKSSLEVPMHRFLCGAWGRVDSKGRLTWLSETNIARLREKSIFCNIGIQQIETQLDEMADTGPSLFSMSYDAEMGAEFYCWSKELERVYEAVKSKLCDFIESAIEELKLAPNEI